MNTLQTNLIPRVKISVEPFPVSVVNEPQLNNSLLIFKRLVSCFDFDEINYRETFMLVCFMPKLQPIGFFEISKGGTGSTVVDVFMIAQICFLLNCKTCVIAHNHPSGNIQPSDQDHEVTKKTKAALKTLDIKLLDHIICSPNEYFSFADENKI